MGIFCQRHEWSLEGSTAVVQKGMVADPKRRIGRLEVVLRLPASFDEKQRTTLEKVALTCPVHASLSEQMEIPVRFDWTL